MVAGPVSRPRGTTVPCAASGALSGALELFGVSKDTRSDPSSASSSSSEPKPAQKQPDIVGAAAFASVARPRERDDEEGEDEDEADGDEEADGDAAMGEAGDAPPLKKKRKSGEDLEATLGERLAKLDELSTKAERAAAAAASAARTSDAGGAALERGAAGDARSLATVLAQALRSNDEALLEEVLQQGDSSPAIVSATVAKLDAAHALPLLVALCSRLERRPARAPKLAKWATETLTRHASHLSRLPDLPKQLSRLDFVVHHRVKTLPTFLALKGRFDLLLNRIVDPVAENATTTNNSAEPLAELDANQLDADDDDSDDDDPAADEASEEDEDDEDEDEDEPMAVEDAEDDEDDEDEEDDEEEEDA